MEARSRLLRLLLSPPGAALLFCLASLLVYAPVLQGEKLWDDHYLVGENPLFRSPHFAIEVFRHWLYFDSPSVYYRPAQNLTYMADYAIWGDSVFGYHLTNILLHGLSGAALFFLLHRLFTDLAMPPGRRVPTAAAVALVWTVHPIHNAAVAYIAGRADSQASLLAITAWLLSLRLRGQPVSWRSSGLTALALLCGLLAFASKEITLVWVALFTASTLWLSPTPGWRPKAKALGAVALIFLAYLALRSLPEAREAAPGTPALPLADRTLLMLRALGDYAAMLCYPDRLMMDRTLTSPAMYSSVASWFLLIRAEYLSVFGLAALALLAAFSLRRHPGRAICTVGAAWFLMGFLPISNLFPLNAEVAEHWIYHASIGFLIFGAGLTLQVPPRWAVPLLILALAALGWRTARRAAEWAEPERFYLANIAAGAGTPRIHHNLASVYLARGDYARQETVLRDLLERFPSYASARINLGICLTKQGRNEEAARLLEFSPAAAADNARRFARTWQADLNLASLHAREGRMDEALAVISGARARSPGTWDLVKFESQLLAKTAGPARALEAVRAYASDHWWHQDAQFTLGRLSLDAGDPDAAIAALSAAARLDIRDPRPYASIARIEGQRGKLAAAAAAQQRAIDRDPDQPSSYLVLADLLHRLGRATEAAEAIRRSEQLRATVAGT